MLVKHLYVTTRHHKSFCFLSALCQVCTHKLLAAVAILRDPASGMPFPPFAPSFLRLSAFTQAEVELMPMSGFS